MNKETILVVIIALLIGSIGGYAWSEMQEGEYQCPFLKGSEEAYVPMGMHMSGGMMTGDSGVTGDGMGHMMNMMVSSEREFVAGMIPHHQEAVDTATEVLERGGSTEEIRTLAEAIVEAQQTEIKMLKQWYLDWYGEAYEEDNSYKPMMRDLSELSGADLDKRFLEDMIPHHMGAIMMAQSVRQHIEHQEITDMADAIMETQTAEIELMRDLLKTL